MAAGEAAGGRGAGTGGKGGTKGGANREFAKLAGAKGGWKGEATGARDVGVGETASRGGMSKKTKASAKTASSTGEPNVYLGVTGLLPNEHVVRDRF